MRYVLAIAVLVTFAALGCSDSGTWHLLTARPSVWPWADSPAGALELLRAAYTRRDVTHYRELFTSDFVFEFGRADSSGNPYRQTPWTRDDELVSAKNLFVT